MIRFDRRRRRISDDGGDFRDFAGELLRAMPGYGCPLPRDSGSVDGCIDLFCEAEGLVVECKSVGSNVKSESERVWQEWAQVKVKLTENLISHDGAAAPARAPYRPWARADAPIKRYVFITSALLANKAAQDALCADIAGFFHGTIGELDGYGHLKKLEVEVIDWTAVWALLPDHPSLVFRWLKSWPSGFAELGDVPFKGFRAFLHGERLPYLSREDWAPPNGLKHHWSERTVAEDLAADDRHEPVVLIGHGGVGKTRSALEIALRLKSKGWWAVRCDGLRADEAGLRQLLEEAAGPVKLLLFVDYLETWPGFEAFAQDVVDLNNSSGHRIRVIATCRTSHAERVPVSSRLIRIGDDTVLERAYSKAVAQHILSSTGSKDTETLAEKCRHNFALAAFLSYLREENPTDFALEVSNLCQAPSFENWIVKRLRNANVTDTFPVANVLAACEFPVSGFDAIVEAAGGRAGELRKVLVADKWIERREQTPIELIEPVWGVFHDVFADVVLAHALASAPDRIDAVDRLLDNAVTADVILQTIHAIARIQHHDVFAGVNWLSRFANLERARPGTLSRIRQVIFTGLLLRPEERLALLAANEGLRDAVAGDPVCDVGLALTAVALSRSEMAQDVARKFEEVLLPLLDGVVVRSIKANLVVRLAFNAAPERYRATVLQWIADHPRLFQTHYLLKAWLDQAVECEPERAAALVRQIEYHVVVWLPAFSRRYGAHFVYKSWLDAAAKVRRAVATAMVDSVEPLVRAWLADKDNVLFERSSYLYAAWLRAAGSIGGVYGVAMITAIMTPLKDWAAHRDNATSDAARFILTSGASAACIGGEVGENLKRLLKGFADGWLAAGDHATHEWARFIFASWLNAAEKADPQTAIEIAEWLKPHLQTWFACEEPLFVAAAHYVFVSWFLACARAGGEHGADLARWIEASAMRWLQLVRDDPSVKPEHVLSAWLGAAAKIDKTQALAVVEVIEAVVEEWLSRGDNATRPGADIVYSSWLESVPPSKLRRFYDQTLAWIEHNKDNDDCDFLLETWLDKRLDFDVVAEACFAAVRRLYRRKEAVYILKHVVRQEELPAEIVLCAYFWCAKFPGHPDVLSRFSPLTRPRHWSLIGEKTFIGICARILNATAPESFLDTAYATAVARSLLATVFQLGSVHATAENLARIHFVRWLRDGRVFRTREPADANAAVLTFDQSVEFLDALLTVLATGEFEPASNARDEAVVASFCEWVGAWSAPDAEVIRAMIAEFTERFGMAALWRKMLPDG